MNDIISFLIIHKHHSVNQTYINHPDILPLSKSTFYKYIDLEILNVTNTDLARKVRFRVKKEYDYQREKSNPKKIKKIDYNDVNLSTKLFKK